MTKDDINPMLLVYVRSLDKTVDDIFLLLQHQSVKNHPIRYKVAYRLLTQVTLEVAKSIIKLTKISAEVQLKGVDENYQSLMSLSRVLTESCKKFYYLAIEPHDDKELTLRWLYFSLVASVKYKEMMLNIPSLGDDPERDRVFANIDKAISRHQAELVTAGLEQWPTFVDLGHKRDGAKLQQQVRDGKTRDDYISSDFHRAIALRLNQEERKHYEGLGNVAVHSSAFMMFFRDPPPDGKWGLVTQAACLYVFNGTRHLALCGLELIDKYPELCTLIDAKTKDEWQTLARQIKEPNYLFT